MQRVSGNNQTHAARGGLKESMHNGKTEMKNLVQPFKFGLVNIYFIKTENGYILVDTGMPGKDKDFDQLFEKLGIDPDQIQLIILTHGHLDHVGSTAYVQKITGAKVLCHCSYADDLAQGKIEPAVPQNFLGKFLDLMKGFMASKIDTVIPDLVVNDQFDLKEFGVSGKVVHTPGHSQSSISILLDNGETLVGDLIREEKPGGIGYGMFFEDSRVALESLKRIAASNPRTIYLSHNATIDRHTLNEFIRSQG